MAVAITQTASPAGVAASSNVATYSSQSIGTASDDRVVVVVVGTELASSAPTDCTIDGVRATAAGSGATQGAMNSRIYYLPVPTGTTADIAVTYGSTNPTAAQNRIAVYSITGGSLAPSNAGDVADTDADPITTGSQTIPTNGGMLAICADADGATARTWTGITEDIDTNDGGSLAFRFSTGKSTTGGAVTTTVSGANGEDGVISWVIFSAFDRLMGQALL